MPVEYDNMPSSPKRFYNSSTRHYLLIDNITVNDSGTYEIDIDGARKGIEIIVSTDAGDDGIVEKQCFNGYNCTGAFLTNDSLGLPFFWKLILESLKTVNTTIDG